MGKVVHGGRGAFSGEINYANDPKKNAKLIAHSDGVFTLNNSTIIDSLESHCGLNPRVKNPYTYMYVFIGLLFMFVFTVSLVRNRMLQEENAIARSIINEYIIVDIVMSDNKAYQKERTQIHESIQENGFYVTWDEVCRLHSNP